MKLINTRHLLLFIISLGFVNTGFSQVVRSDYFMSTSFLRSSMNPALRPDQGYLVVPVLPSVGANVQSNSFNLDNLTFGGENGKRVTFMHQSVDANRFLSNLSEDNYAGADVNIKLLAVGFYRGDAFWTFDLGVRSHADVNIPKGFFGLLKKGFDQDNQTRYNLSNLSATGYAFIELGASYSRPFVDNNLMLGARVKVLGGLADFDFDAQNLAIDAGPEYWSATSKATLRGSAPGVRPKYDSKDNLDGFDFDSGFNIPGFGLGLDLGAVYDMKDVLPALNGLKVSAAINDIGFISWSKDNSINLQSPETEVRITPNDYTYFSKNGSSLKDVFEDAFDDIKQAVNLKGETRKSRVTKLRMNINVGAEYEILQDKLSAGALYHLRFGNYFNLSEFTLSLNYRPCHWFATSASYSFVHSKFDTFGLAMHLAPSKGVTFFLASDYAIPHVSSEFLPTTSKAVNLQFGFSIPLGSKRYMKRNI
ncbi:DUF5723 family protein [Dysgonomonas sp. 521]|uniref:DUF5723 family protein n=1 Tax=Dysgonomonas sp. 521 TaxID=2302932 RepID=UPI0013D72882|nr:DUF5723 family protein [Dysgonomonas sp. 521]